MNGSDPRPALSTRPHRGFTMIELVVVLAILGLLLSIAVPRYMDSLERGRENVLAHNLAQMREAIDRFYGDRGAYPERLDDLVEHRYLRAVPLNPYTQTSAWQTISPPAGQKGRVFDVAAPHATAVPGEVATSPAPAAASQADAP